MFCLERNVNTVFKYIDLIMFMMHISSTVQPHYNMPHYMAVFDIKQSCHGSQNDYFAISLL